MEAVDINKKSDSPTLKLISYDQMQTFPGNSKTMDPETCPYPDALFSFKIIQKFNMSLNFR